MGDALISFHEEKTKIKQIRIRKEISMDIGFMVRVFANCPRDHGSIPERVKPKTLK